MILFLLLMFTGQANAAQVAQVIVDQAKVYVYPQPTSNVVATLKKGQGINVSNAPTEGYYKTRAPNGQIGWISGNDILAGQGTAPAIPQTAAGKAAMRGRPPVKRLRNEPTPANEESFRVLVGYGISNSSYGGLTSAYDKISFSTGKLIGFELQFRIKRNWYWGIRIESISANTGTTQYDSATTQLVESKEIPVQFGVIWSPVTSRKFRFGFGGYIGAVPSASSKVTQTNGGVVKSVEYATTEVCASVAAQASIGLGDAFGLFLDAAYRYDQTGQTPDTTVIKTVPGFKINYSGVTVHAGLELRL